LIKYLQHNKISTLLKHYSKNSVLSIDLGEIHEDESFIHFFLTDIRRIECKVLYSIYNNEELFSIHIDIIFQNETILTLVLTPSDEFIIVTYKYSKTLTYPKNDEKFFKQYQTLIKGSIDNSRYEHDNIKRNIRKWVDSNEKIRNFIIDLLPE